MKILDQEQYADVSDLILELIYGDDPPDLPEDSYSAELHIVVGHLAFDDDVSEPRTKVPAGYTLIVIDLELSIHDHTRYIYLGHHMIKDDYLNTPGEELGELIRMYIYDDDSFMGAELALDQAAQTQQLDHERIAAICNRMGTLLAESVDWTEVER